MLYLVAIFVFCHGYGGLAEKISVYCLLNKKLNYIAELH